MAAMGADREWQGGVTWPPDSANSLFLTIESPKFWGFDPPEIQNMSWTHPENLSGGVYDACIDTIQTEYSMV